jgi:hypothetical protein
MQQSDAQKDPDVSTDSRDVPRTDAISERAVALVEWHLIGFARLLSATL